MTLLSLPQILKKSYRSSSGNYSLPVTTLKGFGVGCDVVLRTKNSPPNSSFPNNEAFYLIVFPTRSGQRRNLLYSEPLVSILLMARASVDSFAQISFYATA